MQLPAELSNVGYPQGKSPRIADPYFPAVGEGKGVIVEGVVADFSEKFPGARPADVDNGFRIRDVIDLDGFALEVFPDPGDVVDSEGGAGDDVEALILDSRDGQVSFDSAALVAQLGVGEPSGRLVDVRRRQALQELEAARPGDLELAEGSLVDQGDGLADGPVFDPDRLEPAGLAEGGCFDRLNASRREPVGALPPEL